MSTIAVLVIGVVVVVFAFFMKGTRGSEEKEANPLGEAEVYMAYGRKKQAIELLETYLKRHPGDAKALALLEAARK